MSKPRPIRPLLLLPIFLGLLVAGCHRGADQNLSAEIARLNSELEATRLELAAAEKATVQKREDAALVATPDRPKTPLLETAPPSADKDQQIRALQTQLAELKKRDAWAFADASASMKSAPIATALDRYQQFLRDFPNSPLAADADRAIAELNTTVQREARARTQLSDPRQPERDALQHFSEGTATIKEITLLLKNRSTAETVKLLGPPSQTYRDGKELGYLDKVIDPATGNRGTLVIGYDADTVATLRIGYLGKAIKP